MPTEVKTIPEILVDAFETIKRDHGVALTHVNIEWQKMRDISLQFPYHSLLNINYEGEATNHD